MNKTEYKYMDFERRSRVILIIILLLLCFLFFSCPIHYNYQFNVFIVVLIIFSLICYYRGYKYENYLDFEPIFIFICLITGFVFPIFVFPLDDKLALFFSLGKQYNFDCINKGTVLSAIGLTSFMIGNISKTSNTIFKDTREHILLNNKLLFTISLPLYLLYLLLDGFSVYKNMYMGENTHNSGTTYLEALFIPLLLVIVFNEFWNKYNHNEYKMKLWYIAFVLFVSFQYMLSGNRTLGVALALPIIIFFSKAYYRVSFKMFGAFIFVAFLFMIFIQSFREGLDVEYGKTWFMYISDMLIPNTTVYLACDYVENLGITWGKAMLQYLLAIIPMGQSIALKITGWDVWDIGSAYVFTKYIGLEGRGIGSNYVAEAYLSFGLFGSILIPFWLGKFVKYAKENLYNSYNISLLYFVLCGFSVYIVRASVLSPIRFMIWALVIAWINKRLIVNRKCY